MNDSKRMTFTPIRTSIPLDVPVPKGWKWIDLLEVARLESGHTPSRRMPEYWDKGDVPWLSLKDIRNLSGRYVTDTADKPTMLGIDNSSARVLPKGTVALCRTASVGKVAILGRDMATSQDFVDWVCGPQILPEYLFEAFRASGEAFKKEKQGTTHQTIYMPTVKRFKVLLPPLSEQKRIANILDKADAIRRKREEAIQTNDDLIYSVYQDWFGNPITNPKAWKAKTIDELCRLVRGSSPRPKGDSRYYGGPVKRLMVEDITRDGRIVTPRIDTLTEEGAKLSRPCPAGTAVMVVSGNVGLPAKLAVDACIHDGFVGFLDLDTEEVLPDFLVLTLEMLKVTHERVKAGAIWQNVTTHQVKAMQIPIPPPEKQQEFAGFVARHEEFTTTLCGKGQEEDDLFNSLIQRAFRGELS